MNQVSIYLHVHVIRATEIREITSKVQSFQGLIL